MTFGHDIIELRVSRWPITDVIINNWSTLSVNSNNSIASNRRQEDVIKKTHRWSKCDSTNTHKEYTMQCFLNTIKCCMRSDSIRKCKVKFGFVYSTSCNNVNGHEQLRLENEHCSSWDVFLTKWAVRIFINL